MVIKSSADEVSFSDLASETGATQISLGDLYSSTGGKFFGNPTVQSSGVISMANMLGKTATNTLTTSATWPGLMTTYGNGSAFNISAAGSSPDVQYQLTSSGTLGTINGVYNGKSLQFAGSFTCSFEIYVSAAQADSLFFFAGCTGIPQYETDTQNGFLVAFDVYSGFVSGGQTAPGIYLVSPNAGTVTTSAFTANSAWENVTVTYTKGTVNTWQVSWRGTNVMTYSDSNNSTWLTTSGQYWGIGARTGGLAANFYIRRVNMSYTGPSLSLPVTSGLMGHYIAESYTPNTWRDLSGAGNHASTSGTIYTNPSGINGKAYIYGGTSASVQFPSAILPSTYTIFHICRYNGANTQRILAGTSVNWLSGFWASRNGVAYHNAWVTDPNYSKYALTDWVLSSDQNALYRANKLDYTASASGSSASSIGINIYSGENSDWAISCLFVYNRTLSLTEIIQMEDWLGITYLNPIAYPPASMTGYTTNITGQPFGNGTYIASASSEVGGTEVAFSAFDNDNNTIWTISTSAYYTYVNGAYTGSVYTLVSGTNHYGEWLQLQMPLAILPTMYAMRTRPQYSNTCPYSWVLAGSVNGSTWIQLDAQSAQTLVANTNYNYYISGITAKYNYFRFIVKGSQIISGYSYVSIADLKIYSKELPSSKTPIVFDANTLTNVDNQISIWNNGGSLGSLYNATGLSASSGSNPVLRKVGTYNHVEFNRNNSNYFILSNPPPLNWFNNSGYNGMTIFIVGRYQSTAGGFERWIDFGSAAANDDFWIGRTYTNSTLAFEIYNSTTNLTGWASAANYAADTNWHIWIIRVTNSASGFTVNWYMDSATIGYTYNYSGSIANRTPSLSYIGRSNWENAYLYGDLRELQIYNTAISDADITNQYNVLKAKWGM